MAINTGQFEIEILKKLNSSNNTSDIQALVNAKEFLKSTDIVVVTNYSDLPAASSVTAGSLYFVEADELLYIPAQNLFGSIVWRQLYDTEYGVIWGWGNNTGGTLGDGTITPSSSPVSVVGGFTDWTKTSSKSSLNFLAIRQNGTLWGWGCNAGGRLGDGTTVDKSSPVSVIGGFTDWCDVSAYASSLAIRTNGTLWAWGCNNTGVLGDGTTVNKCSPVSVVGGFTDWCQVSAGACHTAAVRQNGTLWSWGSNATGRLGDGTTVNKSSPVSVVGGFTDWCQVSAGLGHTAAVRQNGTLWTWGCACNGILGTNSTVSRSSPVSVVGGFTDWCQVSTNGSLNTSSMVALRTNGTLWAWGAGTCGILGDGTTVTKSSPVSVIGGFTDWCQVSAGGCHAAAIRSNGTIWTWGLGTCGRLGDGTTVAKSSPVSVIGGFTDWCQVSAGTCSVSAIRRRTF